VVLFMAGAMSAAGVAVGGVRVLKRQPLDFTSAAIVCAIAGIAALIIGLAVSWAMRPFFGVPDGGTPAKMFDVFCMALVAAFIYAGALKTEAGEGLHPLQIVALVVAQVLVLGALGYGLNAIFPGAVGWLPTLG
jgi:hypothetical protein